MSDGAGAGAAVLLMGSRESEDALAGLLRAAAEGWASSTAPGSVYRASEPLADATARVLGEHPGPLLVAWPVLASFRPEHAAAALGDLAAGADLVVGPLIDGGVYLLGMTRPLGELVALPDRGWEAAEAMNAVFAAAAESGLEVGLLRAERALRSADDVRAALADPLTPAAVVAVLRG
jgi:hypothetical protein